MPKVTDFSQPPQLPKLEEETLNFWKEDKTFEKSIENRPRSQAYVFYDGPPFATGLPHYGHLLASTTKDVVPRYWTMKGYRVERVWGWDCHGLPIENMIEKKLDIKGGKKGIEELGIDVFNNACQAEVLRLDKEWEKIIDRLGRWVNFEDNYKTMDTSYMESVWWGFQQLYQKDLVYEGRKVVLYCSRCSTPLSNFEIAMDNSYQDVKDNSVYIKFAITQKGPANASDEGEYFLAWTTTPWTLPGNVALAVDVEAQYVKVEGENGEKLWLAKDALKNVFTDDQLPEVLEEVAGSQLVGWEYQPLYPYIPTEGKKAYVVLAADFVELEEGTGIVHTAAIYGEDDYQLALDHDLPLVPMLNDEGHFLDFVEVAAGKFFKQAEKPIIEDLQHRHLLYAAEKVTHSYPFCYRCGTPLFYNAVPAWFINIQKLKPNLIEDNTSINWVPEHLKYGRFGKGLENAPDWNISRSRYWGTPMPIWQAETEGKKIYRVIGSIAELKKWAVEPQQVENITDIHRQYLDEVQVWVDDDKTLKGTRIPEVFDCWVESGSMPFASVHYPFENKSFFDANYPAQFISEYIAQTRAWFYTMHVMSVGVFGKPAYENVLTTGTILAEDGSKMSKSKKNYPDPMLLINKYGVDSLRLYLMGSTVMKSENLNFSEKEVSDIRRKVFVIWWNVVAFYKLYADSSQPLTKPSQEPEHVMDKWLLNKVDHLITDVTEYMDAYDVVKTSRALIEFVSELSTWYLRLSRSRIRADENTEVSQVFGYAIYTLAQLFAPITPYFSELVHHSMVDEKTSIHLTDWPIATSNQNQNVLLSEMVTIQKIVELAHAQRKAEGFKVRQPLASLTVHLTGEMEYQAALTEILQEELNVKKVLWQKVTQEKKHQQQTSVDVESVSFDFELTKELEAEGKARDIVRNIQKLRRKAGLEVGTVVSVECPNWPEAWTEFIQTQTDTTLKPGSELKILE